MKSLSKSRQLTKDTIRNKDWIRRNPEKHRRIWKAAQARRKTFLFELKKKGCCKRCGNKDHRVLEWAHRTGKGKYRPVVRLLTWKTIKRELKRCWLLCANCHLIYDYKRRQAYINSQRRK